MDGEERVLEVGGVDGEEGAAMVGACQTEKKDPN